MTVKKVSIKANKENYDTGASFIIYLFSYWRFYFDITSNLAKQIF